MSMPIKSGCVVAFISLLSACAKEAPTESVATTHPAPDTVVAVGPQVPKGELSDYRIVMNALEGKKPVVPEGATEEAVDWPDASGIPLQVERMGCAVEDQLPPHCHMVVQRDQNTGAFQPDRKMIIAKAPDGTYSLTIVSLQVPDQMIGCIGLRKNAQDPKLIEGTCAVTGGGSTGVEHNFAATIERVGGKIRVHFAYQHGAFNSGPVGIHNGDGHATEL